MRWKQPSQRCLLVSVVVSLLVLYYVVLPFGHFMFDNHSLRGGELGRMIDTLTRTIIFRRMMQKRRARLDKLGIQLPPMKDIINKKGIPNLPQAAVAEILIRSKVRARQMQQAGTHALEWSSNCRDESNTINPIPNHILQPDHGDSFQPVHAPGMDVIRFDHASMRKLVQERFPALLPKFDKTVDKNEQAFIWSLCALYSFGGYVFGTNDRNMEDRLESAVASLRGCSPIGISMFRQSTRGNLTTIRVAALAFTPRHAILKRILERLEREEGKIDESVVLTLLCGNYEAVAQTSDQWDVFTCSCAKQTLPDDKQCCKTLKKGHADGFSLDTETGEAFDKVEARVYVKVVDSEAHGGSGGNTLTTAVEVSIVERPGTPPPAKTPKSTIQQRLSEANCNAGWICNRCLKNALLGTHDTCKLVCPTCYKEIICNGSDQDPKKNTQIDVLVKETRTLAPGEQRIPRIIHQTWFTEPSVDRYPQLARLQNSWKNLGWEYRFYNDTDVRQYIAKNFPSRFLDAFDSIIPGAFKADFFRYLVLLKDGGVYSDADILLDINLDSFIIPSMSFFVPRDIVGDYAGENFCLWNGMMGAAPGHPFMARAAEMLLTNILNRVDYYDMERQMCQSLGTSGEVWKMRALTILSLSGPCLLGSAVNKVLGRSSYLSQYNPGWLIPAGANATNEIGDALLLIASRADMGALRFSDVDRNLLVASTGMTELSKDPILTLEEAARVQEGEASHIHYSNFEHVNDVFGAEGIYTDNLVTNEIVELALYRDRIMD